VSSNIPRNPLDKGTTIHNLPKEEKRTGHSGNLLKKDSRGTTPAEIRTGLREPQKKLVRLHSRKNSKLKGKKNVKWSQRPPPSWGRPRKVHGQKARAGSMRSVHNPNPVLGTRVVKRGGEKRGTKRGGSESAPRLHLKKERRKKNAKQNSLAEKNLDNLHNLRKLRKKNAKGTRDGTIYRKTLGLKGR